MLKALALMLVWFNQTDSVPTYEMPEVVVTATRLSLPAQVSPWPVEVIESEEAADLSSALAQSVSADVRAYGYQGHSAFPFLSGVSASRVLILEEGVHMNSRRDGVIDLSLIPTYPGDRVEVVKGPLSALYGSSAIGGVANLIHTKKNGINVSSSLTDQAGFDAGARAAYQMGRLGLRASGSYLAQPGFRHNDDVTRYSAGAGAVFTPGEALSVEANAAYTWREMGVPGPLPDTTDTAFIAPVFGDSLVTSLYDRQKDRLLRANVKTCFGKLPFSGYLNLYAVNQDFSYNWRRQAYSEGNYITELAEDNYNDLRLGADLQLSAKLSRLFRLAGGLSLEKEMISVRGVYTDSAADTVIGDRSWDAEDSHLGIWAELLGEMGRFRPLAAARLEYSERHQHFFSPELGLSYQAIPEILKLSAAYGRSFRAPTLNSLFWAGDEYSQGNPDLVPERSHAASVSADANPLAGLKLSVSGSWRQINEMIAWVPAQGGVWRPENVDQVTIWGTEARLSWSLGEGLLAGWLGAAYKHAVEERTVIDFFYQEEPVLFEAERKAAIIPPLTLKGEITSQPWERGKLTLSAAWTGKRVNYYPDYSTYPEIGVIEKTIEPSLKLNASASQEFFRILSIEVGVRNILNDRTPAHFGGTTDLDYPTAPRRFYAGLSITY